MRKLQSRWRRAWPACWLASCSRRRTGNENSSRRSRKWRRITCLPDRMSAVEDLRTTWLSGAILTLLNKLIFPVLWFVAIGGVLMWVYFTSGRISIAADFRFIAAFTGAASVLL